jgi:acetyl esterase/lipase
MIIKFTISIFRWLPHCITRSLPSQVNKGKEIVIAKLEQLVGATLTLLLSGISCYKSGSFYEPLARKDAKIARSKMGGIMSEEILSLTPPPSDDRLAYGSDPNQFGDLRLPKGDGPFPVLMNIHGGFWRAKYDLLHAGHFCAAITRKGIATWNLEYRRNGNPGGGWPGTFEDIASGYRFLPQIARQYKLDPAKVMVAGHSAGGQLALCLAAHEPSVSRVISLAGVVDLQQTFELHLSNDAVVEFLGGKPSEVPDHYLEADPMRQHVSKARQVLLHGSKDDVIPPAFSRRYVEEKKKAGENVALVEIAQADHFDLIDPRSVAWVKVEAAVLDSVGLRLTTAPPA